MRNRLLDALWKVPVTLCVLLVVAYFAGAMQFAWVGLDVAPYFEVFRDWVGGLATVVWLGVAVGAALVGAALVWFADLVRQSMTRSDTLDGFDS